MISKLLIRIVIKIFWRHYGPRKPKVLNLDSGRVEAKEVFSRKYCAEVRWFEKWLKLAAELVQTPEIKRHVFIWMTRIPFLC